MTQAMTDTIMAVISMTVIMLAMLVPVATVVILLRLLRDERDR